MLAESLLNEFFCVGITAKDGKVKHFKERVESATFAAFRNLAATAKIS